MEVDDWRPKTAPSIAVWSIPVLLVAFALRLLVECRVAPACLWGSGWKPVLHLLVGIQWALPGLNLWALGGSIPKPGRGRAVTKLLAVAGIALFVLTVAGEDTALAFVAGLWP